MRILKTYTGGLLIPDTISKKKKEVVHKPISDGGTTTGKTKSGNIIFVEGENEAHRKRALQYFLKVYNNDFSTEEQKKNGNLVYKLTTKITKMKNTAAYASWGVPNKTERKKYHIISRKIYVLGFSDSSSKMESDVVHELVHVRKYSKNEKNHVEQKVDFETVGRMSKEGIKQTMSTKTPWTGTYYNVDNKVRKETHSGNKDLAKLKLPFDEKTKIASKGIIRDRKLLTGSINTNIVGNTAVTRAEKLFPKSFLNARIVIKKRT